MAEMDTGLSNLWWIQKPHWLDTTDSSDKGIQMSQWRDQMALKLSQADIDRRSQEAQIQGTLLGNKAKAQQLEGYSSDVKAWEDFLPQLNNAKTADDLADLEVPAFRTPQFQQQAATMIHGRSTMLAQTTDAKMFSDFLNDRSKLDGEGLSALNQVGPVRSFNDVTPEHLQVMKTEGDRMREESIAEKVSLFGKEEELRGNRMMQVEEVKNKYRASLRNAMSVLSKAKLLSYQNELHQITFDPLLESAEKSRRLSAINQKYGVTPDFREGEAPAATEPVPEENPYHQALSDIDAEIAKTNIDLIKNPKKPLMDFGTDNRVLRLEELKTQRDRLQQMTPKSETTLPHPKTKAERDALPAGSSYVGPDGQTYIKQ